MHLVGPGECRTAFVTGSTGFLGGHVVRALLGAGWAVVVTGRSDSACAVLAESWRGLAGVTACPLDLAGADSARKAFRNLPTRPEVVIHCAAYGVDFCQQDLEVAVATNLVGSMRLLAAAEDAGVGRFVHIGTCYEYGPHDGRTPESSMLAARGLYGVTKAATTLAILDKAATFHTDTLVLRPFAMYGPGDRSNKLVPQLLAAARRRAPLQLTPGRQVRDWVFVSDVAEAIVIAAASPQPLRGQIINLGTGQGITLRELASVVARVADAPDVLYRWSALPYRPGEVMSIVADAGKAERLLGWRARTSLPDGIVATMKAASDAEAVAEMAHD